MLLTDARMLPILEHGIGLVNETRGLQPAVLTILPPRLLSSVINVYISELNIHPENQLLGSYATSRVAHHLLARKSRVAKVTPSPV